MRMTPTLSSCRRMYMMSLRKEPIKEGLYDNSNHRLASNFRSHVQFIRLSLVLFGALAQTLGLISVNG